MLTDGAIGEEALNIHLLTHPENIQAAQAALITKVSSQYEAESFTEQWSGAGSFLPL
jgi:hypothetical protein